VFSSLGEVRAILEELVEDDEPVRTWLKEILSEEVYD